MDRYTFTKKRDAASLYYAKHEARDAMKAVANRDTFCAINSTMIGSVRWYYVEIFNSIGIEQGYLIDKGEQKCKHS